MVLKVMPLATRDAEEDPSTNALAEVEEKVAESRHSRGQHSVPVDGTTVGSSDVLAGHSGEDAASRAHEEAVVERAKGAEGRVDTHALVIGETAGVAREESNLGEVAIVEEVAAVEVPMT